LDKTLEKLVSYTRAFSDADFSETARQKTVDLLFDTIACAVAGSETEPCRIAARIAARVRSEPSATVFGFGMQTSPELAALANTMMVRTYDYNDCYTTHPSDMTAGILAAGEVAHSSGSEVLSAIAMAYELGNSIGTFGGSGAGAGFDAPFFGLAVALAAGKLWGFNEDQLANAASLAMTPSLCLGAVRWGELSMMKGCATAFSTRAGIFGAMLAQEGFTGPPEPFEGIRGLFQITGPLETHLPSFPEGRSVVELTGMKPLPAENNTIGTLELILENRDWLTADELESIDLEVSEGLDVHVADEPKYDPHTRETADHSFPYMIARTLVDGEFSFDTFRPDRVEDPALRPLMRKIRVHGSKEMSEINRRRVTEPRLLPIRVRARTRSGRELNELLTDHSGWATRPQVSRDVYNTKLDLCSRRLQPEQREQIREAWWNVASAKDIGEPIKTLVGLQAL
jgi:2-methylcitrate dehydratase